VVAPVHCALMRSSVEGGEAAREAGEAAARSAKWGAGGGGRWKTMLMSGTAVSVTGREGEGEVERASCSCWARKQGWAGGC
jgi:hypothetical protein